MHVASVMLFEGPPPPYEDLVEAIEARLSLVPRYRQRLAFVPLGQGRPKWVDDPHLNLRYHVRSTALPSPGSEDQLKALAGRVFSQQLDRDKPLWEVWLVEGLADGQFAMLSKTHTRSWTGSPAWTSSPCCSTPRPSRPRRPTRAAAGCRARTWRVVGFTIPARPPVCVPVEASPALSSAARISGIVIGPLLPWLNWKNSIPR